MIKITCPFCEYSRELAEVPFKALHATCPKCKMYFKLHEPFNIINENALAKRPFATSNLREDTKITDPVYCRKCGYKNYRVNALCCACGSILDPNLDTRKLSTGEGCIFLALFMFASVWFMAVILISSSAGDGSGHSQMTTEESMIVAGPLLFFFLVFMLAKSKKKKVDVHCPER